MIRRPCECCRRSQYCYRDGRWTEWICWNCGKYDSNTPAFMEAPYLFENIVRQNGRYFMTKYAYYHRRTLGSTNLEDTEFSSM